VRCGMHRIRLVLFDMNNRIFGSHFGSHKQDCHFSNEWQTGTHSCIPACPFETRTSSCPVGVQVLPYVAFLSLMLIASDRVFWGFFFGGGGLLDATVREGCVNWSWKGSRRPPTFYFFKLNIRRFKFFHKPLD
jgi:hypothetical protein